VRKPDLIIGPVDDPQTLRWHLFKFRGLQVALHRWCRSDSDRALHDHTGNNISILLTGRYREWFSHAWEKPYYKVRWPFVPYFRIGEMPHRVELYNGPLWSIWVRFPSRREWGFWCPKGWRHWRDYVAEREGYYQTGISTVGRGCDD
jgi:hypothetical protein